MTIFEYYEILKKKRKVGFKLFFSMKKKPQDTPERDKLTLQRLEGKGDRDKFFENLVYGSNLLNFLESGLNPFIHLSQGLFPGKDCI